jgi:HlyD family secretion protein
MDVPRTPPNRRPRRIAYAAGGVLALAAVAFGISRLEPAPPTARRDAIYLGTVERGTMVRDVRAPGTLVPEDVRWITARSSARVERVVVQAGAVVAPDTVLLELTDPDVEAAARDAALEVAAAEADASSGKVELKNGWLDRRAAAAAVEADWKQARLEAAANEELAKDGLVSGLVLQTSRVRVEELDTRRSLEQERLSTAEAALRARERAIDVRLDQLRAAAALRREEADALRVRAGIDGVLQQIPVEPGQALAAGTVLAKVARPDRLKAELRVPETQAKDIAIGMTASIDTRVGIVEGRVSRIDPAVVDGTVRVDVTLDGALPKGARPDLSVDGTITIETLPDVLHVGRPAFGQPGSRAGVFRLDPDGREAVRIPVELGRASAREIEIVSGLSAGDRVILSDTAGWDGFDRIRID